VLRSHSRLVRSIWSERFRAALGGCKNHVDRAPPSVPLSEKVASVYGVADTGAAVVGQFCTAGSDAEDAPHEYAIHRPQ
jgi:hypothetical protein